VSNTVEVVSSVVVAVSFLTIASALIVYSWKHRSLAWARGLFLPAIFCLFVGFSRSVLVIQPLHQMPGIQATVDACVSLLGLCFAIFIWPLLARTVIFSNERAVKNAYSQLQSTKQIFESFMSNTPAVAVIKDREGRYLYVNDSFKKYFASRTGDPIGKTDEEWLPPQTAAELKKNEWQVWQTKQPQEFKEYISGGGGQSTYWYSVKFIIQADPEPLMGVIAMDVTSQRQMEEQLARNEQLFRLAVAAVKEYAIFLLDPDGIIETWNEGAARIKGYSSAEVIGKNFSIFYCEKARANAVPARELEIARTEGKCETEGWRMRKDGSMFWASVLITPFYDRTGKLRGYCKVTRDMTKQREMVEELERARDKAIEASSLKSAFVANISHELRTPLAGILGMNQVLLYKDLDPEERHIAEVVQESSKSLLNIVNDLLDLSKMEAGTLKLKNAPMTLPVVVEEATTLLQAAAVSKAIVLNTIIDGQLPAGIIGDAERVKQILLNLIGNAVKFTQQGHVTTTVNLVDQQADHVRVCFTVVDTGVGIPEESQSKLFRPFVQADVSTTRQFEGTGLGLAISKNLVTKMGGQIGFSSKEGVGSTFWFTIPFQIAREQPIPLNRKTTTRFAHNAKVLIVEDNPVLSEMAKRQLQNIGLSSDLAASGEEALRLLGAAKYDAVLMDCHLPGIDGFETSVRLRKSEIGIGRRTPIIAITAGAMAADEARCRAAGMDDYLAKPFTVEDLRSKLIRWIPFVSEPDTRSA